MRIRSLSLVAALLTCTTFAACAPPEGDDDDDDGGLPTPSGTNSPGPTPSPSPTGQPPAQDVIARSSFVSGDGTEAWICLESQFNGSFTGDAATAGAGACDGAPTYFGDTTSSIDQPTFHTVFLTGPTVTGCDTGAHDWWFDYLEDGDNCEGCVNNEYLVQQTGDDAFGFHCGVTGADTAITALSAYTSATTGDIRFDIDSNGFTIVIDDIRVYDQGGAALVAECSPGVTLDPAGDGIFDGNCNAIGASGNTYTALFIGTLDGVHFSGSEDFAYVVTPAP